MVSRKPQVGSQQALIQSSQANCDCKEIVTVRVLGYLTIISIDVYEFISVFSP